MKNDASFKDGFPELLRVTRAESTYGLPRFLGVPKDNQLRERSSLEGILNGQKISEVVASDTEALDRAGITWDRAVHVLKCLAISSLCQAETISPEGLFQIIGFNSVYSQRTHLRYQYFDDPIVDTVNPGDQSPFDSVATSAPEFEIRYSGERTHGFINVINEQTLLTAEYYHLLEKGNRYAMTGDQLATLVRAFKEDEFNSKFERWLPKIMKREMYGLAAPRGHVEMITFGSNPPIKFEIMRQGSVTIDFSDEPRLSIGIDQKGGRLKELNVTGKLFHTEIKKTKDNYFVTFQSPNDSEGFTEEVIPVNPDSTMSDICDAVTVLLQTAKKQPDKNLSDNSELVFKLAQEMQRV